MAAQKEKNNYFEGWKKEVNVFMAQQSLPPRKQAPFRKWKKPSHVKKISFTLNENKQPIRVGGEATGDYYLGRLRFNDGKTHRIVIKRFKPQFTTNRLAAAHFAQAMKKLVQAGVRVPKMSMIKIPTRERPEGEYVVVAPFFGSRANGSAFEKNHVSKDSPFEIRLRAMEQLTRIANAGLLAPLDAVNVHSNHAKGVRVIDLDFTIEHILFNNEMTPARLNPRESANEIQMCVNELSASQEEKTILWAVAIQFAAPHIHGEIERLRRMR